ncbi:unnamed protein product [Lathyrus sativus]|nr:unnamed protein product [Lathyrus sativus]
MASKNTCSPLSEFNMKTQPHNFSSSSNTSNNYGSHVAGIKKAMKILEIQFGNPHASSSSSETIAASVNGVSSDDNKKKKNNDDGITHSLPHQKYGPYICPKCNQVFVTSQKFASHASSHYKLESKEERKKRYMSRIRKRPRLHIQKLNDGTTTFLPLSSSTAHPPVPAQNQIISPPPTGIKIKLESANN